MADTRNRSFAENVNHIAELDNSLGYELVLRRSNIVLNGNSIYSALTEIRIFNRATSVTELIFVPSAVVSASGIDAYLLSVKTALELAYSSCLMTYSVAQAVSSLGVLSDVNISVALNGNSYYLRSINIKISEIDGIQYDIDGEIVSPLEITPSMLAVSLEPLTYASTVASHIASTSNPHSVTKTQVGLSNVDNTSDALKPVSTAAQTALNLKLNTSSYTAADVLAKVLTMDGAGSGLDADLLDGQSGTYYATTQSVTDKVALDNWRDSMMSKAEFNAMAKQENRNNAGSGFIEWGKSINAYPLVNVGLWVGNTQYPSTFALGREASDGVGISKSGLPIISVNGIVHKLSSFDVLSTNGIKLPTAPTVLPSTAVLSQQQTDSGVIKHADASNSGLIINGKFDTDTSGWTAANSAIISVINGKLDVANTVSSAYTYQAFATVVGKTYIYEVDFEYVDALGTLQIGESPYTVGARSTAYPTSSGRYQLEFIATTTLTYARVGSAVGTTKWDNIAVFPKDSISRSDLVFLESWHEDVSEKDFIYPLGNVQYLGTTGDSGTPVVGAFAGSATYSLFSDTWQADRALVGKGYVWSTLSDANKKAFVANPENNCYLDGDKVIQVRYRVRVVMGWGDSWENTAIDITSNSSSKMLRYTGGAYALAKGKLTSKTDIGVSSTSNARYVGKTTYFDRTTDCGAFFASYEYYGNAADNPIDIAYEGKCYALPIALISR